MCGIAGFLGNFNEKLLNNMGAVIDYRGPDDFGLYFSHKKGIGLVHCRLAIIDTSVFGHQPLWDSTRKVVVVFNGEIYNYKTLRSDLINKGFIFRGSSDTEVLVNLYLYYGREMLSVMNGIFAFALWDSRDDSMFLARDGIGVKPLYYSESTKGFLFASELKALLQESSINRTINPEAVHYYLTYLWCPAPHTMLKAVKKLEPGHALVVKDGKIQKHWQFYDLPYNQPIMNFTVEEAIENVRASLRKAVQRQMVADVTVGAFLSGGLDSSAVVAFTKQFEPDKKLQCFTVGIRNASFKQEGMVDDLPYARRVAEHLNVDLHTVYVGSEMVDQIEKMVYHLDEPQADPASINVLFISQLAREHGIKVLLSGAGGDDVFTGYRRHYALMQERYWSWMPKFCRRGFRRFTALVPSSTSLCRRFSKAFRYADLDGDERIVSYFYWTDPSMQMTLYSHEMARNLSTISSSKPLLASLSKLQKKIMPVNRMLYLEGKHFLADHNLNYTDKMSMAAGVEVRVPLLDLDLIDLAARLPISFKQNGKIGKWIFKKAMEPYLPYEVIYRRKTGFGVPLRHWLRNELKPIIEDVLSQKAIRQRGLFDPEGVRLLIKRDMDGRIDGTYTIFSLVCIELWCRIFIDSRIGKGGYFK